MQLRRVGPADEPFLADLRRPEIAGEYNTFDDEPGAPAVAAGDIGRMVVALDDGTPIGSVSWHAVSYGPNRRSVAWNIGITLLPDHRGRGHGAAAQRLLADHLFATTDANRIEASTDTANLAEQRALERAGFRPEGLLRGAQYRAGAWHDLVLFARLRGDA
jgi:RimJ/RimL family protein N-acetyltransferase